MPHSQIQALGCFKKYLPMDKLQHAAASWNFSIGTVLKVIMKKSRSRKVLILRLIQVSVSKIWKVQSRSRKSQKKSLVKLSISRFQKFESRSQSRTWDQGRKSLGIGLESENPVSLISGCDTWSVCSFVSKLSPAEFQQQRSTVGLSLALIISVKPPTTHPTIHPSN